MKTTIYKQKNNLDSSKLIKQYITLLTNTTLTKIQMNSKIKINKK